MRFFVLGLMLACAVGCSDGESDGEGSAPILLPTTEAVGAACDAPADGTTTVSAAGPDIGLGDVVHVGYSDLGHNIFDPSIILANEITVTVTSGCAHMTSIPSITIEIPRESVAIGTHDVPEGASAKLRIGDIGTSDPIPATSGSVTLTGFDPATGSLCGETTLDFPERTDFPARTVTATFAARTYCD